MINRNFNENEVENAFEVKSVGKHRVRIESAEETKSSKGNDMIKVVMQVSGMVAVVSIASCSCRITRSSPTLNSPSSWTRSAHPEGQPEHGTGGKIGACKAGHEECRVANRSVASTSCAERSDGTSRMAGAEAIAIQVEAH